MSFADLKVSNIAQIMGSIYTLGAQVEIDERGRLVVFMPNDDQLRRLVKDRLKEIGLIQRKRSLEPASPDHVSKKPDLLCGLEPRSLRDHVRRTVYDFPSVRELEHKSD